MRKPREPRRPFRRMTVTTQMNVTDDLVEIFLNEILIAAIPRASAFEKAVRVEWLAKQYSESDDPEVVKIIAEEIESVRTRILIIPGTDD